MATGIVSKVEPREPHPITIDDWLQQVASFSNAPESPPRKRKRDPLSEMSENIQAGEPSTPPSKRPKADNNATDILEPVDDRTPRPTGPQLLEDGLALRITASNLPQANNAGLERSMYGRDPSDAQSSSVPCSNANSAFSQRDARSGTGTTPSGKRKRADSPVKDMGGLKLLRNPVYVEAIQPISKVPKSCRPLARAIEKYGKGLNFLPYGQPDLFEQLSLDADDFSAATSRNREMFGQLPEFRDLEEVVAAAKTCDLDLHAEPSWNCEVHAPLLRLALKHSPYNASLAQLNITTAQILPDAVPDTTADTKGDSKKADFAIVLKLSEPVKRALKDAQIKTITQTAHRPLKYAPIAINVETKRTGTLDDALYSLSVWVSAQITITRNLLVKAGNPGVSIPPLPVFLVLGHDWELAIMENTATDVQSSIKCWKKLRLGATDSLNETLQIVAGLQYLMRWAAEVYQPWFEDNILIPLKVLPPQQRDPLPEIST